MDTDTPHEPIQPDEEPGPTGGVIVATEEALPVRMERLVHEAGFREVQREFLRHWMHTEIVTARK